jgi:hypothetical protein
MRFTLTDSNKFICTLSHEPVFLLHFSQGKVQQLKALQIRLTLRSANKQYLLLQIFFNKLFSV